MSKHLEKYFGAIEKYKSRSKPQEPFSRKSREIFFLEEGNYKTMETHYETMRDLRMKMTKSFNKDRVDLEISRLRTWLEVNKHLKEAA